MGSRMEVVGYANCGSETFSPLSDPQYYQERCCKPKPRGMVLPRCFIQRSAMPGGVGIKPSPEFYVDMYGPKTRIVGVSPRNGLCGTIEWRQNFAGTDCCDGVTPLTPDPNNSTSIHPGSAFFLRVAGGKTPLKWSSSSPFLTVNGARTVVTSIKEVMVQCLSPACPGSATITVTDDCSRLRLVLEIIAAAEPMAIEDIPRTVSPGASLIISVTGGVPPFLWSSGGLTLVGVGGGQSAVFTAPSVFCGTSVVSVTDFCGSEASCYVTSTSGRWVDRLSSLPNICSGVSMAGATPQADNYGNNPQHWNKQTNVEFVSTITFGGCNLENIVCGCGNGGAPVDLGSAAEHCANWGAPWYFVAGYCCYSESQRYSIQEWITRYQLWECA